MEDEDAFKDVSTTFFLFWGFGHLVRLFFWVLGFVFRKGGSGWGKGAREGGCAGRRTDTLFCVWFGGGVVMFWSGVTD